MFWNNRPNEKEVFDIIDEVNKGLYDVFEISEMTLNKYKYALNVLSSAKWTHRYPAVAEDKYNTIEKIEKLIELHDDILDNRYCVDCKYVLG